jgi:hypothetical protein
LTRAVKLSAKLGMRTLVVVAIDGEAKAFHVLDPTTSIRRVEERSCGERDARAPARLGLVDLRAIDATRSFDLGLALTGFVPLLSCAVLWRFWPDSRRSLQSPRVETLS